MPRTNLDDLATVYLSIGGRSLNPPTTPPTINEDEMCVTLSSISISPSAPTVLINQTQQFVATGLWSDGSSYNITSAVTWGTSDANLATIANGTLGGLLATGTNAGSVNVTATMFGVSTSTSVTIPSQRSFRSTAAQGISVPGTTPARVTAVPIPVPDDLGATCYLSFSNKSSAYPNAPHGSGITGMGFWMYEGISTMSGIVKPTGTAFAGYTNQTVPNGGGTLVMGPFDGRGRGQGGFLCALVGNPTGVQFPIASSVTVGGYQDGTSDGSTIPGSLSYNANAFGDLRIFGFQTARRRLGCMGDSLANAYSAGAEVRREQSMFVRLGRDNMWSVDVLGIAGMTLAQATSLPFYNVGQVADDHVVLVSNLSINSLPTWANLAAAQADYAAFIAARQAEGYALIVLCTLTPSDAYPDGTYGTLRNAVNAWLLTQEGVGGITKVVDLDGILRDPADHTQLLAAYRCPDRTHYTVVGHLQASIGITAKVNSIP